MNNTLFVGTKTEYETSLGGVDRLIFSGGELKVDLVDGEVGGFSPSKYNKKMYEGLTVVARIQNSDDLMELLLATEVLKRFPHVYGKLNLTIPYLPYARQDRITEDNSAFSLKVFTKLINDLGYQTVTLFDAHSDVGPALIDNSHNFGVEIVGTSIFQKVLSENPHMAVVSPDAGAYKKVSKIAEKYNRDIITATKSRDVKTGKLSAGAIHGNVPEEVLIVDDICDGGRTFTKLASVLRDHGAKKIFLYVTHGIFSQGLVTLIEGGIDRVYTTNTFLSKPIIDVLDPVSGIVNPNETYLNVHNII